MNKNKTRISTRTLINKNKIKMPITLLTMLFLLPSCATHSHKESFAHTILRKENDLIEKIKAERSAEDFKTEIEKNENLRRAEVHLMMGLNEMQKANEIVTKKLINQNQEEEKNGK